MTWNIFSNLFPTHVFNDCKISMNFWISILSANPKKMIKHTQKIRRIVWVRLTILSGRRLNLQDGVLFSMKMKLA